LQFASGRSGQARAGRQQEAVVAPGVTSLIAVRRNDRFIAVSLAANFCVGTRR
jgi:hypothetical protein